MSLGPRTLCLILSLALPVLSAAAEPRRDLYGDPLPPGAVARLGTVRYRLSSNGVFVLAPDEKSFVSSTARGALLADVSTGKIIRRFQGEKEITSAAFSQDGKLLATLEPGTIRVWDVVTAQEVRRYNAESGLHMPDILLLAPDNKTLAGMSSDGDDVTIHVWDLVTGKKLWNRCSGPNKSVKLYPLGFQRDGKAMLVYSTAEGCILFLDTATGEKVRATRFPETAPNRLLSPDGKTIVTFDMRDTGLRVWDAISGKRLYEIPFDAPSFKPEPFCISPDSRVLACGNGTEGVRIFDLASGKHLCTAGKGLGHFRSIRLLSGGKVLAFCVWRENTVRFWDAESDKEVWPTEGHRSRVKSLAFSPDGGTLISGGWDGTIRFGETVSGKEIHRWVAHREGVNALVVTPDGKKLVSSGLNEREVRLWDISTQEGRHRPRWDRAMSGKFLAISPDGQQFASTDGLPQEGTDLIRFGVWDLGDGKLLRHLCDPRDGIDAAAFSPDGKWLVSNSLPNVVFGPDGGSVFTVDKTNRTWELATGKPSLRVTMPESRWSSPSFSPDGKTLAFLVPFGNSNHGTVTVWDMAAGKARWASKPFEGWSKRVIFSPTGRLLATAGPGPWVRLWDVATGKMVRELAHDSDVCSLAFSPDGNRLAAGSTDTTILIWEVAELIAVRPSAKLTPGEFNAFWSDLAGADAGNAHRAIWTLIAASEQTVPWLKARLRPAKDEKGRIARLVVELDHDDYAVRQKAEQELAWREEEAEPALRNALEAKPSFEVVRRAQSLLEKLETSGPSPTALRELRAIEVLEQVGTPEARDLLRELAGGAAEARLTREAAAALRRSEGIAKAESRRR